MKILIDNKDFFLATIPPHRRTINVCWEDSENSFFDNFYLGFPTTYFLIPKICGHSHSKLHAYLGKPYDGEESIELFPLAIGNHNETGRICLGPFTRYFSSDSDLIDVFWQTTFDEPGNAIPICFNVNGKLCPIQSFWDWHQLSLKHPQIGHFFDYEASKKISLSGSFLKLLVDFSKQECRLFHYDPEDFFRMKSELFECEIQWEGFFRLSCNFFPKLKFIRVDRGNITPIRAVDDILNFVWRCLDEGFSVSLHDFNQKEIGVTLKTLPYNSPENGVFVFNPNSPCPRK